MKRCTVEGCRELHWARGMCKSHYGRWWRYGTPTAGSPIPEHEARRPARVWSGESSWAATPLAVLPAYSRSVRDALARLAESNPSLEVYEREKARILGGG